jgi:hypothetical protein
MSPKCEGNYNKIATNFKWNDFRPPAM